MGLGAALVNGVGIAHADDAPGGASPASPGTSSSGPTTGGSVTSTSTNDNTNKSTESSATEHAAPTSSVSSSGGNTGSSTTTSAAGGTTAAAASHTSKPGSATSKTAETMAANAAVTAQTVGRQTPSLAATSVKVSTAAPVSAPVDAPSPTVARVAAPVALAVSAPSLAPTAPAPPDASAPVTTAMAGVDEPPSTAPALPATPPTPSPLAEALLAAYRESESSTQSVTATTQSSRAPATTGTTPTVVATIPVDPYQIALNSDGSRLYGTSSPLTSIANQGAGTVQVVNTATNSQVGDPIPVGLYAESVVVSPTANRAYVTALNTYVFTLDGRQVPGSTDSLVVIDTSTNEIIGSPIPIGASQNGSQITYTGLLATPGTNVAVSPDGRRVYIAESLLSGDTTNTTSATVQPVVYVFDGATNTQIGDPIAIGVATPIYSQLAGSFATSVLVSPTGDRLYVSTLDRGGDAGQPQYTETIHAVDPVTGAALSSPIVVDNPALATPGHLVLSPDGKRLYVETAQVPTAVPSGSTQLPDATVLTYDTRTGQQIGAPIDLTGYGPLAVSSDGKTLYAVDVSDSRTGKTGTLPGSGGQSVSYGSVTAYDATTGAQLSQPVTVGLYPTSVALNSAGTRLYVANAGDDTVSVVDVTSAGNGTPLQFTGAAVIAINDFIAFANTSFGQLLAQFATTASSSLATAVSQTSQFAAQVSSTLATQVSRGIGAEVDAIQQFVDTIGTLADDAVPGLGAGLHVFNILVDLGRGNGGQAAFDSAQFLSGLTELSKIPLVRLFGVLLDVGSQAAQGLPASLATPLDVAGAYLAGHPIGAFGAGTSAVVGAIGNAAFHSVGVPQVAIDAVVKPAQQAIQDGADTLDELGHDAVDGASHLLQGISNSAANFFSGIHFP